MKSEILLITLSALNVVAILVNCVVARQNAATAQSNADAAEALAQSTRRLKAVAQVVGEYSVGAAPGSK